MNVCIIGDGLTSLSLAKNLVNKKINVHIYHKNKSKNLLSSRTIGISKNNLEFFEKEIQKLSKKNTWAIKKIEIYSDKLINNKILNFENNKDNLFYMIKNDKLYNLLKKKLLKNKFFKKITINKDNFFKKLLQDNNYDLIINCDQDNPLSKKYFIKRFVKDYKNIAYTTIFEHEKLKNNTAIQIFSNFGPIAFLPISNTKTSVVCSVDIKNKKYTENEIIDLIKKNNPKFKIKKILQFSSFELKSLNIRNYYYKNILAFGDLLHRIHPLAGQGFNMTIRDIKILSKVIQDKINLGLQLDSFILKEFEKKTKHKNFIFSNGIDFIYEFFNFDKKTKDKKLNKILKYFGTKKILTNTIIKFADKGLNI
jgi:2-octaprenyl-6-methoxyphenol hydroxylase